VPFSHSIGDGFVLMHDNARPHVANVVNNYLDEIGIRRFKCPACSPDLQQRIRLRPVLPENLQGLRLALEEEFEQIPQINLSNLINSMPRRLNGVIRARGGHKRY
jgi:hypothetical protein